MKNNVFEQQTDVDLTLETVYANLYRAYTAGDRGNMIKFYGLAQQINIKGLSDEILAESKNVFEANIGSPDKMGYIQNIPLEQVKLNVAGCLNALQNELNRRSLYRTNYTYAQRVLYQPNHRFEREEVLYQAMDGQQLKVSDFLSVSKYAISVAEAIDPSNEDYAKASAAITTLQGIDATLHNKPEDKPVNKMLHLATSFLSSVVKSTLRTDEGKRNVTITAILLDLAIDFLCKK